MARAILSTQQAWAIVAKSDEYKKWKAAVRKLFGYQCQHCGQNRYDKKNRLECHHIKPKSIYRRSIFKVENALLLCKKCHIEEHKKMRIEHPEYNDKTNLSLGTLKDLIKKLHFKQLNRRRYTKRKRKS